MSILQKLTPNANRVHYVYIVPADKMEVGTQAIQRAAWHHQAWYQWKMGNSKTFSLASVEVFTTDRPSDWFANNPTPSDRRLWFFENVKAEARRWGARIFAPGYDYMTYTDAQPDTGANKQSIGGGVGFAVMAAEDILGLMGRHPSRTICRQIGGDAHELGHTFGLHHPLRTDPDWGRALMGTGYANYSDCILRAPDLATLNASAFFSENWSKKSPAGLCSFNQRPRPVPRPRPVVGPRP